ncbi:hypothetical protein LTR10_017025 [Elasticomyces elasticus]|uniref:Uncharacterized protein n=1 Tax=Exophiala sideris TaxID=1016849 RepID=A0ABR0IZI6_9EURO|nr:hypothetical protein LTR10_017025 [Elasticomyces elasticus]KAK5023034.1 hypothetical protein LTS07_009527 [Exophiala sideris]KAK5026759.1 hypothetical protein LTR13_009799 [Exophiala sideris]KAK5052412.1 hypothetical protein LTR69_009750 [Exophiala sideris]KAK5178197.1 hypothetical protein LTR44_009281 [Eurotiomycetes sp. CCFEE 6388]
MATAQKNKKIQGPVIKKKDRGGSVESNHAINTIHFALQQDQEQRVTIFDSSITPEPFLDSVSLERLRKKQQTQAKK